MSSIILALKENENIFEALVRYSNKVKLKSAIFTGLGALNNITLGFYQRDTQQHILKNFVGTYELASLIGNITVADNKPFVHIHASIAAEDFVVFGGHVVTAFASASTEISITTLSSAILRQYDPLLRIHTIQSCTEYDYV